MKKIAGFVLCLLIMGTVAFAQDKAFGGGVMYNFADTFGTLYWPDFDSSHKYDYSWANWAMRRNGFGGFAFFSTRYLELNLGALWKIPNGMNIEGERKTNEYSGLLQTFAFQLGAYMKYPLNLSHRFVLFPTIGADFELTVDASSEWWHDIWARAGMGVDFFCTEQLFLRGHAIYGAAFPVGGVDYLGVKISHGLLVKLGVGWLF